MNKRGKSDRLVVLTSPPNKAVQAAAVEGSSLAKGTTTSTTRPGHSAGVSGLNGLDRVREVARRHKDARFTALLHHVDVDRLRQAYWDIRPGAAPGADGVTWQDYGKALEANPSGGALHRRVYNGAYRAKPPRRVYIPKSGGPLPSPAQHRIREASYMAPPSAFMTQLNAYEQGPSGLVPRCLIVAFTVMPSANSG